MPVLEVRHVSKNFGAIQALTDVSFQVERGEVVGLMGDNGAGKSTVVKTVAGNFPPSDGEIVVDGEVCHFHKPVQARAKGIEVVYQDLALADNLTAAQNVFLGREIKKGFWPIRVLDKQAMVDRSAALFKELKSETRPRDLVKKMSGGQRQAVAIAPDPAFKRQAGVDGRADRRHLRTPGGRSARIDPAPQGARRRRHADQPPHA